MSFVDDEAVLLLQQLEEELWQAATRLIERRWRSSLRVILQRLVDLEDVTLDLT